jgi:cyclohexa-1,5-dienecarbonyl-CoA hydratase
MASRIVQHAQESTMTTAKVRSETQHRGAVVRLILDAPPGNILDIETIDGLRNALLRAENDTDVKAVVIESAGPDFSFGASIPEHAPGDIERSLPRFHDLFRDMFDLGHPLVAVVRGRCLGGGLELAAACNWIFASPDSTFGLPEVRLGVFAPLGSILLPPRMGRPAAEMMCMTGRILSASEALTHRLVDFVAADPAATASAWIEEHLLAHSASALHYATRAARTLPRDELYRGLEELERMYLRELMHTEDAREGITAFLDKRAPQWRNR